MEDMELELNEGLQEGKDREKLNICNNIDADFCGDLLSANKSGAIVRFIPNEKMKMDDKNMVLPSFLLNAATYAAYAVINKKYSMIISIDCKFLAPIEVGQEIIIKAKAMQQDLKKCEVKIEAYLMDIKIFDAICALAIFDAPIFKLKLK